MKFLLGFIISIIIVFFVTFLFKTSKEIKVLKNNVQKLEILNSNLEDDIRRMDYDLEELKNDLENINDDLEDAQDDIEFNNYYRY